LSSRGRELFETSKIFDDGKTVVPVQVRRDLGVNDGDKLIWVRTIDGYKVRSTLEPKLLIHETGSRGGITCKKCGNNYEANVPKCPKCGTLNPMKP
jgi:bifunctional DNA-binding transcriptional regulator/antitoxin component of YhaV-PrlF toxin-antitoxin module